MCLDVVLCVFFFKQKTAYEMRISDWSSDGCSSDLARSLSIPSGAGQQRQTLALLAIRSCPRRILARVGPCGFLRSDRELRGVPMSRAASWRKGTTSDVEGKGVSVRLDFGGGRRR